MKKQVCPLCGNEITLNNYTKHLRRHQIHPETFTEPIYKITHEGLSCQYCGKLCKNKNSLCNHERQCKNNPNRQYLQYKNIGRTGWNKNKKTPLKTKLKISKALKGKKKNFTAEQIQSMIIKSFETKKKNGTLNSSKDEKLILNNLIQKYGLNNVYYHYKEERYPFECDFYIKPLDLFIEINLHWTHGGMPFDKTNPACLNKLNTWKEKAKKSKYFKNAIDVWTRRDILKLNTAKINQLNYITIYNLKELNSFISKVS